MEYHDSMPSFQFHPAVAERFNQYLGAPSEVQAQTLLAIQAGHNTLIAVPTGSGKTLAAFLAAIDQLVHNGLQFPRRIDRCT
jgi:ATP-dependent Lhr-like helicase